MTQHAAEGSPHDSDAARLADLIQELGGDDGSPKSLLREHLQAAHSYLLGSMPAEYQFNLKLAEGLLPDIKGDKVLHDRVHRFLQSQREPAGE